MLKIHALLVSSTRFDAKSWLHSRRIMERLQCNLLFFFSEQSEVFLINFRSFFKNYTSGGNKLIYPIGILSYIQGSKTTLQWLEELVIGRARNKGTCRFILLCCCCSLIAAGRLSYAHWFLWVFLFFFSFVLPSSFLPTSACV